MADIVIDIETVPNMGAVTQARLDNVQADKRLKDPDKIELDLAEKREKIAAEAALSPLTGKVLCVSVLEDDANLTINCLDDNELAIFQFLDEVMKRNEFSRIVTFNGNSFDIPFLIVRSAILGVKPLFKPPKRYSFFPYFDIRSALTFFNQYEKGTLHEWCLAFDIPHVEEYTGADVFKLYQADALDKIVSKCATDVSVTNQLKNKVERYYGNQINEV